MTHTEIEADDAIRGWDSPFKKFSADSLTAIVDALLTVVTVPGAPQLRAWRESIPKLQGEVAEFVANGGDGTYTAILEYQLPMEYRRIDAVFLLHSTVIAIELKGKRDPSEADFDQAQAYARDLRAYHAECESRPVHAVLIPTASKETYLEEGGVHVCSPDRLDELIRVLDANLSGTRIDPKKFLSEGAYRPLPTLVRAAREFFVTRDLRRVKRAAAQTEPANECLLEIVRTAASEQRKKLVLVAGVPGAGKTLVGLRLVHSSELDDLAVQRANGAPTSPAAFLSGNGPLVEVLAYELREAGGGGTTFVRSVKKYVERYQNNPRRVPNEHVLVYDEAQRAFDAAMVAQTHRLEITDARSEPELFVEFAERVPQWCVVVALIGTGQEIHKGEEAGIAQWATAIKEAKCSETWDVHGPPQFEEEFSGSRYTRHSSLSLDHSLRSHLAFDVHRFVGDLVSLDSHAEDRPMVSEVRPPYGKSTTDSAAELRSLARKIAAAGHHFRITRDLNVAKDYLRERYAEDPLARYGIVASSRDRDLVNFEINNDFQTTKRLKFGPWYGDNEDAPGGRSCRLFRNCVTEFGAQGLELDATLVAWGTDFIRVDDRWDISRARRYVGGVATVKDPARLRSNAYRVLLTRARDATVVFVPQMEQLDATYSFLVARGFEELG